MNKTVTLHTLTPTYDPVEDRIRLCINYQDIHNRIDMMLTRAFLLKLLPSLEEFIYRNYPNSTINNTIEQNEQNRYDSKQSGTPQSLSSRTQTDFGDLELFVGIEDLLVSTNFSYDKTTQRTTITFTSKKKHSATLICGRELLEVIITAIKESIPKIQWGIADL
ncbi:MAG: hypothetical protein CSA86_02640 [Arcobacter sp.]|nr:MAG: hypothetical protein CSA86_02640 [Arcobacter sp.]